MPTVEQLRALIAQMPKDPFPRYGLAMELRNQQKLDESLATFAELERDHPGYVPMYLMYAQTLAGAGRAADARAVLERGIAEAAKAGNAHAKGEMEQLLATL